MRNFFSAFVAASLALFFIVPINIEAKTNQELLGYEDNEELLGVASAFSVFVEEDFGANGCDCEGRIFAGHSANVGSVEAYSVADSAAASIIIGNGTLSNFDLGNHIFVYGSQGSSLLSGDNIYQADLIDAKKEFERLRKISLKLFEMENGTVEINPYWNAEIDFIGNNTELNVFNLDAEMIDSCNYFFNYEVPEGSYVIVNVSGDNLTTYTQLYGMQYAGHRAQHNKDEVSKHILFNFYESNELTVAGTGTFYGTIFAPFSNAGDDMTEGAHNAGGIVAKNYIGGIEFGDCTYDGGEPNEIQNPTETTTTTTTATICTTDSSIIDTQVSKETTKGTTTTTTTNSKSTTTTTSTSTNFVSTSTSTTTNSSSTSTTKPTTKPTTSTTTTKQTTSTTKPTTTTTSTTTSTKLTTRPTSSTTTTTTFKSSSTNSETTTTTRRTETTTSYRGTSTSTSETTKVATTTTRKVEGTTEVSTHPTALDQATDTQTSTTQIKEETTTERETSVEGTSNDQTGTATNGTTIGTETTTTVGTDGTIYTTTTSETTTTGTVEKSVKTGDSFDVGKAAGACGLAMIIGLLAVCGKKEE